MPIIIKDYTWEQTESNIYITIPLKGTNVKKIDLFSSKRYIKV